jgi:hypothetical protein
MNKIRAWIFWDWKSIRRIFIVFFILISAVVIVFFFPDWKRNVDSKNYTEKTEAILVDIRSNEFIGMTEFGNQINVCSYKIKYRYFVEGIQYESTDMIPNSVENNKLLTRICNNKNDKLKIKYDPKKPNKSIVTE